MFISLCLWLSLPINHWDLVTRIWSIGGFNGLFQSGMVLREKMDSKYCRGKNPITLNTWTRRQPQHTVTDLPVLLGLRLKGTLEKAQPQPGHQLLEVTVWKTSLSLCHKHKIFSKYIFWNNTIFSKSQSTSSIDRMEVPASAKTWGVCGRVWRVWGFWPPWENHSCKYLRLNYFNSLCK